MLVSRSQQYVKKIEILKSCGIVNFTSNSIMLFTLIEHPQWLTNQCTVLLQVNEKVIVIHSKTGQALCIEEAFKVK